MTARTRTNAQASIQLSRKNTRPLLRTVNGTQYARNDDHDGSTTAKPDDVLSIPSRSSQLSKKRRVEEDPYASPLSSQDEDDDLDELQADHPSFDPKLQALTEHVEEAELVKDNAKTRRKRAGATLRGESKGTLGSPQSRTSFNYDSIFDMHCATVSRQRTGRKWSSYSHKDNSRLPDNAMSGSTKQAASAQKEVAGKSMPSSTFKNPIQNSSLSVPAPTAATAKFIQPKVSKVAARNRRLRSQDNRLKEDNFNDDSVEPIELPGPESFRLPPKLQTTVSMLTPPPSNDADHPISIISPASSLSAPLSSPTLDALQADPDELFDIRPERLTYHCPMCKTRIPKGIQPLDINSGERMTMREQLAFCRKHREHDAQNLWNERGYPIIQWEKLDARLKTFHKQLDAHLSKRSPSTYRNSLEKLLSSGRQRTLLQSLHAGTGPTLIPGYYGTRGARIL